MKNGKNKDQNDKKYALFQIGKFDLGSMSFWLVVIVYSAVVLTLKYKFDSKIADFLYTISFFAAIMFVSYIIYIILREIVLYIKYRYLR